MTIKTENAIYFVTKNLHSVYGSPIFTSVEGYVIYEINCLSKELLDNSIFQLVSSDNLFVVKEGEVIPWTAEIGAGESIDRCHPHNKNIKYMSLIALKRDLDQKAKNQRGLQRLNQYRAEYKDQSLDDSQLYQAVCDMAQQIEHMSMQVSKLKEKIAESHIRPDNGLFKLRAVLTKVDDVEDQEPSHRNIEEMTITTESALDVLGHIVYSRHHIFKDFGDDEMPLVLKELKNISVNSKPGEVASVKDIIEYVKNIVRSSM